MALAARMWGRSACEPRLPPAAGVPGGCVLLGLESAANALRAVLRGAAVLSGDSTLSTLASWSDSLKPQRPHLRRSADLMIAHRSDQ